MLSIYNNDNIPLYLVYFKWYIIVCIICIIVIVSFKYLKLFNLIKKQDNNQKIDLDTKDKQHLDIKKKTNTNLKLANNTNTLTKTNTINTEQSNTNTEQFKINTEQSKLKLKLNTQDIFYIYWTGGYDSTFRLCEMLIIEKKIVQPLYVQYALDNDCPNSEESCNKKWVRRNREHELLAMKNIKKAIFEKFPWCKKILLPTIYIKEDINDTLFSKYFDVKFYKHNLWPAKRSKHQYLFLSKYAYYHKIYIDTGVLGIHENTVFGRFLNKYLEPINDNYYSPIKKKKLDSKNMGIKPNLIQTIKISKIKNIKEKHYMHYLRFPCFGKTKKILLIIAKNNNFDDILSKSWSCWFPDNKTGKECGKCPMCRERIVKHPDNYKNV